MSKRILHLASFNHLLKREYADFTCPDPLALINLGDLIKLNKEKTIKFLQKVLINYKDYNPVDDISIRTAVSREEERRNRPYKLYLKPEASKKNALYAYEIYRQFLKQNPDMDPTDAWLMFAMNNPEVFSGNVSSDIYWPEKVIMEVTEGRYAPLGKGEITNPETHILDRKSGQIEYKEGSNSPVVTKFLDQGLEMKQIETLMKLATTRPCTLEFIYGQIRKINRTAPLIFDVRVLGDTKWRFYNTNVTWHTLNGHDFLCKLNLIANITIEKKLHGKPKESNLLVSPTGTTIQINQKKTKIRDLFDVDIFSPQQRKITIIKGIPEEPRTLNDYFSTIS